MKFRPDDSPVMEVGEKRNFAFKLAPVIGGNTIDGTPTITASNLTIGDVTVSGSTVTAPVTASQAGTHMVKLSADLTSEETVIGTVRVKVIDSTCQSSTDRYN